MPAGRVIDAGLMLLDRQIVDCNGRLAGKVDDLQLDEPEGGGAPVVTAILSGPGALGGRVGGRLGAGLAAVTCRLSGRADDRPARLPWALVKHVGNHVAVSVPREQLESNRFEEWTAEQLIGRIPGARHAVE